MEPSSLDFLAEVQGDPRRLSGPDSNACSLCPGPGCVLLLSRRRQLALVSRPATHA